MQSSFLIVLGGGVDEKGALPSWVEQRLDTAIKLYQQRKDIQILCSGLGRDILPISEASAMKASLVKKGVAADKILTEEHSRDTIENAYYSRKLFIDPMSIHGFSVISSEFHIKRTQKIFEWIFPPQSYEMHFISAAQDGISDETLEERVALESTLLHYYTAHIFPEVSAGNMQEIELFVMDDSHPVRKGMLEFLNSLDVSRALYYEDS